MRKIGILGGTFDPPHIGHLVIAEEVRLALDLEEVWFIPTSTPPHKQDSNTDANHRVAMTELAIEDNPAFKINTIEINRLGKSYTIDTVKELKQQYPGCEFYFIIGADMVEYLPHWLGIDELVNLVQFVGVNRSGYVLDTPYRVLEVDVPLIDISSSMLRKRLNDKRTIKYFITNEVYGYIRRELLYEF